MILAAEVKDISRLPLSRGQRSTETQVEHSDKEQETFFGKEKGCTGGFTP